ncbi:hypothetical protein [Bdellovibrio sp. HCB337]|uniref:hypothetical protein n=1 Tax=Bdellovibrio sp. HCB337 TaxID=3394358 RepID=UPI0039A708A1
MAYIPEEGQVTATLGPYWSKTNFESTTSPEANPSFMTGLGLVALGDINNFSSLEITMFYTPKDFIRQQGDEFIVERSQLLHIGMGYRYWINPYFSSSLAFYSSYTMGDPMVVYTDFPPGQDINTSARDTTEYGFDWSIQGQLWGSDQVAVILDTRYSFSVTPKQGEHEDTYGVLLGLRYLVQEEKKVETRKP